MNISAGANVAQLRVVTRRPDGSGVVQIPMARSAMLKNPKATSGSTAAPMVLDDSIWAQVIANFANKPGPVPVYFGHIPNSQRRDTPAAGFIDRVWSESDVLWGEVSLGPRAFSAVVEQHGFRGFSVELDLDPVLPTGEIPGWVLTGGAITNTPALDVQWVAASGAAVSTRATIQLSTSLEGAREQHMAEVSLETMQAQILQLSSQLKAHEDQTAALRAKSDADSKLMLEMRTELAQAKADRDNAKLSADAARLTMQDNTKAVDAARAEALRLQAELQKAKDDIAAAQILKVWRKAVARGVNPSLFEGLEKEPTVWLSKRFVSVEAFSEHVDNLPGTLGRTLRKSENGDGIEDENQITDAQREHLVKLGIDPKYATVRTERDLIALQPAEKE